MEISVYTRSARSFGGNSTYSLVGQFLEAGITDYGPAVRIIELTACFRGGKVGHASLRPSHDRFHAEYLPTLPTAKFHRKKAKIELIYETVVTDAHFLERYGFLSAVFFSQVVVEVAKQLLAIDAKLKRSDDFDPVRFHQDVAAVVRRVPQTDDELKQLEAHLSAEAKKRRDALSPWELLAIEWDEFHPSARNTLNDPFFWDCSNDYAPNGNDTGADLLADFKKWNKRHPTEFAFKMAVSLLKKWGIPSFDYYVTDEADVLRLKETDDITLQTTNEAMIAVAFAAIKHRGWCDQPTIEYALDAVQRQRIIAGIAKEQQKDVTEWFGALETVSAALRRMPIRSSNDGIAT